MENMREYWAREAEMMRDKSAILGSKQQVLQRGTLDDSDTPNFVGDRANVLIVQVTKNGRADSSLQNQYDKLKNDLYDNKEWDIYAAIDVESAAQLISNREGLVDNLVYLHHGSDWGYNPPFALQGDFVKETIEKRNDFLVSRILAQPNNNLSKEAAKKSLNKKLLDDAYEDRFVNVLKLEANAEYPPKEGRVNVYNAMFGVEKLLKCVKLNGTFVDASCFQGSNYDSQSHSVFDSLLMLSFGKINIYTNTNATGIEIVSEMMSPSISGSPNFQEKLGTIMNDGLTSGFNDKRGWIYFDAATAQTVVTKKDIMLNAYKKPVIEQIDEKFITPTMSKERKLWFSKKFREWRRKDVEKYLKKTYPGQPVSEKLVTQYFDTYTKKTKEDAKL